MSDAQQGNKPVNPFEALRSMRDAYLESWSKVMIDAVNTDAYAQATGTMLDAYLTASLPFREAVDKTMHAALQQMSMPSRDEVVGIAERMTHVEMRLDDMETKLERLEQLMKSQADALAAIAMRLTAPSEQPTPEVPETAPAAGANGRGKKGSK